MLSAVVLVSNPSRALNRHAATLLLMLQPLQGVWSGQDTPPKCIPEMSYSIVQCHLYTTVCRVLRIAFILSRVFFGVQQSWVA